MNSAVRRYASVKEETLYRDAEGMRKREKRVQNGQNEVFGKSA